MYLARIAHTAKSGSMVLAGPDANRLLFGKVTYINGSERVTIELPRKVAMLAAGIAPSQISKRAALVAAKKIGEIHEGSPICTPKRSGVKFAK